jgi:molybdenum cofactor synthesis domain-containing protein
MRQVGILTISDRGARGEYEDRSGPAAADLLHTQTGWQIARQEIIPDDFAMIVETLIGWCEAGLDLVLTTGGTGFSPRDVTPEATRQVIERETPGIAEALRAESLKITRHAMLSRAVAGIRGRTLIINLPGNPKAIGENLAVLLPVLPHALDLLAEAPESETTHRSI